MPPPSAEPWPTRHHGDADRLDRLVEFVVELASGRLDARMAPSERSDEIDSVIVGLNMLAEELQVLTENLEQRVGERTKELATAREELQRMALHDSLTGLANRTLFTEHLAAVSVAVGPAGTPPAVLLLDLDGFKAINDTYGHAVGDQLLIVVADRLRRAVRAGDVIARLGGDEFAIVVADAAAPDVLAVAERARTELARTIVVAGRTCRVAASIGVRLGTDRQDPETLLDDADIAMYAAKTRRPGGIEVFDPAMRAAGPVVPSPRIPAATADDPQLVLFHPD